MKLLVLLGPCKLRAVPWFHVQDGQSSEWTADMLEVDQQVLQQIVQVQQQRQQQLQQQSKQPQHVHIQRQLQERLQEPGLQSLDELSAEEATAE